MEKETTEILEIIRQRPDLELLVLKLVLEQVKAAGIPEGGGQPASQSE